jgi:peptidoglycan/LPS O-acetylase OafA/YrhL
MGAVKEKIPSLDGIRAVAIASVIVLHLTQRYGKMLLVPDGVGLFFVLSGYLITFLLLREKVSKGRVNLAEFYLRRTFRILPPMYAYVLFLIVYTAVMGIPLAWSSVLASVLFLQNVSPYPGSVLLEHTWSLAIEEQFYIVWPMLMLGSYKVWGRRGAMFAALGMIVGAPLFRVAFGVVHSPYLHSHVFGFMPSRMDSLGVGCFLALADGTALFERIYAKVSSLWWVAALSFCVGTPLLLWRSPQISHAVGLSLDAAMMGFFILWAARNPETVVGRFLNNRVVAEVGVLSYSIYLWQTFFIHPDTGVRYLNQMPLGLFCIVIAALLSRVLVEKPFFAIRDRVLRSRRARLSIGNVKQALN